MSEAKSGVFKKGDRVLCKGWSSTKDFIAVVEKRSCSGASYAVRSELPLYRITGHIKGLRIARDYYGYVSSDDVREVTLLNDLAQIGREPLEC